MPCNFRHRRYIACYYCAPDGFLEELYLRAYDSVAGYRSGLTRYFAFDNATQTHQALGGKKPGIRQGAET